MVFVDNFGEVSPKSVVSLGCMWAKLPSLKHSRAFWDDINRATERKPSIFSLASAVRQGLLF